jgi:predicted ATPase
VRALANDRAPQPQNLSMLITRLRLKNWRNFRDVDVRLGPRCYVIGANASGKSNFLDTVRFLRTVAQRDGGGLQKALKDRGGLSKLRSLHARSNPEVRIDVELSESIDVDVPTWRYALAFRGEGKGQHRVLVTEERVEHLGEVLIDRPGADDRSDPERLTQTYLEQTNNNQAFRALAEFFSETTYLHLVPQLLKHADDIGSRILENDPFGQGLLQRIAKTATKTRDARLRRINKALEHAVPLFSELRFVQDPISGLWHLEANFKHWRINGAWQREDQFSDGTLRLIGLLWALQEGDGVLLLEEPELSLNDGIVEVIPQLIDRVLRDRKKGALARQVLISTHSDVLLSGLQDPSSVLLIEPGPNGSTLRPPADEEVLSMQHGLNAAEVLLPKTRAQGVEQLALFQ